VEALYKGLTFLVSGVFGNDDDIDGTGTEVDSAVYAAELDYYFAPKYLLSARFENEDVGNAEQGIQRRVLGQVSYFWNQNVSLRLEGTYDHAEKGDDRNTTTGWFRVDLHI